jgi:hypothetical protein
MHPSSGDKDRLSAVDRVKRVLLTLTVTSAFALGLYSLFLASVNADKIQPLTAEGMRRTATAADAAKIEVALGGLPEPGLVLVVLDASEIAPDLDVEIAVRNAARSLSDSSLAVSVRLVNPGVSDFATIVAQNGVNRFPAVLAVKKKGGIVLVTDNLSAENLVNVYRAVWGKKSSCEDAKSAVY